MNTLQQELKKFRRKNYNIKITTSRLDDDCFILNVIATKLFIGMKKIIVNPFYINFKQSFKGF